MKDKEKQIEEKANCFNCVCKPVCMKTADIDKEKELISWNKYVKQYGCHWFQPKLPEDSVVLSKEELNSIQANFFDSGIKYGSKETAEQYERELKAFIKVWKMAEDDAMSIAFYRAFFEKIGELAKQFGVEIKE